MFEIKKTQFSKARLPYVEHVLTFDMARVEKWFFAQQEFAHGLKKFQKNYKNLFKVN